MPGPVSQSYDPPSIRQRWMSTMSSQGFRYFVLKAKDVFSALDEDELEHLDYIMRKIESYRLGQGKPPARSFWVYARHWPKADEVRILMEQLLGITLGQPYSVGSLDNEFT